ncbi:MAG: M18 family aminopeptidase [Eubacteriales bacterium]
MDSNTEKEYLKTTEELISFIEASPTAFHAVDEIGKILQSNGFVRLGEHEEWNIVPGGRYYVTRNGSSVIAFAVPENYAKSFMITASHTDSPTFKLKTDCEVEACGKYVKLNVEGYGGMILSSWLDRPLSIAGRAVVKEDGKIKTKLVKAECDLVLIPNVAMHQNRQINSGFSYNIAVDMMPLFASKDKKGCLADIVAESAGCEKENILGSDLYLYNRTPASIWGAGSEFFSSARIDNLQCAYSTLEGFCGAVNSGETKAVCVYSSFDNEETGSATKQGAGSQFLNDTLSKIAGSLGFTLSSALASSFMVSADNGHAKHPNHPELSDAVNSPAMNEGVVIKSNAAQKYTTEALSASIFNEICKKASVPTQLFANRSDMAGGSTLGSISNTNVALLTVDIGLAQLAMHSSYETAGCRDTSYMISAITEFYKTLLKTDGDGIYMI